MHSTCIDHRHQEAKLYIFLGHSLALYKPCIPYHSASESYGMLCTCRSLPQPCRYHICILTDPALDRWMSRQINYEGPTHESTGSVLKDRLSFFSSHTPSSEENVYPAQNLLERVAADRARQETNTPYAKHRISTVQNRIKNLFDTRKEQPRRSRRRYKITDMSSTCTAAKRCAARGPVDCSRRIFLSSLKRLCHSPTMPYAA